jgi:hypothetical protein
MLILTREEPDEPELFLLGDEAYNDYPFLLYPDIYESEDEEEHS